MSIFTNITLLLATFFLMSCSNQGKEQDSHKASAASTGQDQSASLSEKAQKGKVAFETCNACHSQQLDPPKAPPMFAVQKHYKNAHPEKEEFVAQVVAFVQKPTLEKAIMKRPVKHLGLMPPLPLPEENLVNIAHYVYEGTFQLPCAHWKAAVKNAEVNGKVDNHIMQDKMKIKRFCSE